MAPEVALPIVFSAATSYSPSASAPLQVSLQWESWIKIWRPWPSLNIWNTSDTQHQCTSSVHLGEIWVESSRGLDFEETPRLRLVIKAETASSSSFMAVNLILQDVNDNLPRFQLHNYVAYVREAQGYDFPIIQVQSLAYSVFIVVDFS